MVRRPCRSSPRDRTHRRWYAHREAAYTLTAYLESKEPWIEFDPPSPFSARQLHPQRRALSASLPEHVDPNFNCNGNGCPGPNSSTNLDAEDSPTPLTILELGSGTGIIIAKLAEIINQQARDVPAGQSQFLHTLSYV